MNGRTSLAEVLQSRTKAGLSGFGAVSPSHMQPVINHGAASVPVGLYIWISLLLYSGADAGNSGFGIHSGCKDISKIQGRDEGE